MKCKHCGKEVDKNTLKKELSEDEKNKVDECVDCIIYIWAHSIMTEGMPEFTKR